MSEAVAPGTHRALGLTDEEYAAIETVLKRPPSAVELAMYAVMWSEHCSYKSSRVHLARLPTTAAQVIVGPGENAGVVDVGDGLAIALRIESHNHPSAIEPYQGAATGVGGILRDIFTMGARPIALMDPLFLGPLEDDRSRYLLDGIVRGIAGYGNSVGVPTVGGQLSFDPCYAGNPLVNVFCLGLLRREHLVLSAASGVGNLAVLLGARTGRDGIGGVSVLASAEFAEADTTKRPSVQVGDPFEEKRLIEACLELLGAGLVVGIQDLGGAGLACATSETAAKGGCSMDVDLAAVPLRDPRLSAVEVMTSESQERMLAIVAPEHLAEVQAICRRFEVEASVIGTVAEREEDGVGHLRIHDRSGALVADVPAASLAEDGPRYRRPLAPPADLEERRSATPDRLVVGPRLDEDLLRLLYDPAWVYRQFDHQLFLNTVAGPGQAEATVLRLAAPGIAFTGKGLALSADANPGWCAIDARRGSAMTVAESVLNVSAAGARPLALVNCLNFGNPEHEEVMWQLSEAIDGMAEACRTLEVPVVGGNVSLYNASEGRDIDPTPVVVVVGLIDELGARPPGHAWGENDHLVLLGEQVSTLSGSRWARELHGHRHGALGEIDWEAHRRLTGLVRGLVAAEMRCEAATRPGIVHGLHDLGDGGLALALAECAIAASCGAEVSVDSHLELFGEHPGRLLVATGRPDELLAAAEAAGVRARVIGRSGGSRIVVDGPSGRHLDLGVEVCAAAFHDRLPTALDATLGTH